MFTISLHFSICKAQAVRIDKDGNDARALDIFIVSSYLDCVKQCLENSQCRYIVKSGQRCFLKATTPIGGPCAPNDECAVVLGKFNFINCIILNYFFFSN